MNLWYEQYRWISWIGHGIQNAKLVLLGDGAVIRAGSALRAWSVIEFRIHIMHQVTWLRAQGVWASRLARQWIFGVCGMTACLGVGLFSKTEPPQAAATQPQRAWKPWNRWTWQNLQDIYSKNPGACFFLREPKCRRQLRHSRRGLGGFEIDENC